MQFKLPELGEGVHEGELVKWKVKVGDQVGYDQSLCEIMTDKATVEIPSAIKGKVMELNAKEGEVVKVGQVMLTFEGSAVSGATKTEAKSDAKTETKQAPSHSLPASPTLSASSQAASLASPTRGQAPASSAMPGEDLAVETRALAAPSTRRFARESGIDVNRVSGSGPNGRVLKEDIERFVKGSGSGATAGGAMPAYKPPVGKTSLPAGAMEERVPLRGLRKAIAGKMRQSKDHAAHFTYVEEADMSQLVALRKQAKEIGEKEGVKVTYLPFIMKAMVAALKKYPILNSSLDEEKQEIVFKRYYNIGLSIQTDDGLTAPVVKDVANKSILHLAHDIEQMVVRARQKKLTQDDFHGSTITLTNAGTIGGLFATPIINYPEVAILGFNKIFRKPVVLNTNGREEIAIRDWTYFSISLDHRIVDGAVGAEFMKEFIRIIENPTLLVLDTLLREE
jgi:pyruvate dehydrogenase E2 component (dihydrolipoamide acetyltransferase)